MLAFITELPGDKPIAGAHCIPVLENGNLVMVWDRDEKVLTTIGGRLEKGESPEEGLNREALEEAGIVLKDGRIPFACWYWNETDTYTVFFLAEVDKFVDMPERYEKTGYVITNFETAIEMIAAIEGNGNRIEIVKRAGILSGQMKETKESIS